MPQHKTSAWPLALLYAGLIIYASLYPFADWNDRGVDVLAYLWAPRPQYWTGFDLLSNALGYAPLGFLLALSALRTGRGGHAVVLATLACVALSLTLEALQSFLPARVPSNVDLALNGLGGWAGAVVASLLERIGAIDRWSRFRARWFVPDARGGLVLLALWPLALLFPAAVPLGLGQVFERLEAALAEMLHDTPFLEWLPVRDVELQPLVAGAELVCVMFGLLIPCLLAFGIIRQAFYRFVFMLGLLLAGVGATVLSAALTYGPAHAWGWLTLPVELGLALAFLLAFLLVHAPGRVTAALLLLILGIDLSLLNQAPTSAYFAQTLQTWEQGRFIRFHGVVQWLGWLWPYATGLYVLGRVWGQTTRN